MRRIPNLYEPTSEDQRVYRLWVRRLAVFYGLIALAAVLAVTIGAHQPVNQATAGTKAVASASANPMKQSR
jgi:hypothetical protein